MFHRKLALKFCSFQKKFFLKIMENVDILKKNVKSETNLCQTQKCHFLKCKSQRTILEIKLSSSL